MAHLTTVLRNQMIFSLFLALSACIHHPTLQLVESTATETNTDNPDIPNASQVWVDEFSKAQQSIDLASFYISPSPQQDALDLVWETLKKASNRGVQIRILIDKKFSEKYPEPLMELRSWKNTKVQLSDYDPGVMHAKYFVVDRRMAFIGSQNFDYRALEHIFELGFATEDSMLVKQLLAIFNHDWGTPTPEFIALKRSSVILAASPPNRLPANIPYDLPLLLDLITEAKDNLKLQFLSYNNKARSGEHWYTLDDALIAAVERGVQVELMVSDWSTKGSKGKSLEKLRQAGVTVHVISVPEHSSGFIPFARTIHAKYIVADKSSCWLGTSNASKGYFTNSRNVGLMLYKRKECEKMAKIFSGLVQL